MLTADSSGTWKLLIPARDMGELERTVVMAGPGSPQSAASTPLGSTGDIAVGPILTETCIVSRGFATRYSHIDHTHTEREGTEPGSSQEEASTHLEPGETPKPAPSSSPRKVSCSPMRAACTQGLPAPVLCLPRITPPPTLRGRQQGPLFHRTDVSSSGVLTEPLSALMDSIWNCNERNILRALL